jgi:hypothetical protein
MRCKNIGESRLSQPTPIRELRFPHIAHLHDSGFH